MLCNIHVFCINLNGQDDLNLIVIYSNSQQFENVLHHSKLKHHHMSKHQVSLIVHIIDCQHLAAMFEQNCTIYTQFMTEDNVLLMENFFKK